MANLWRTQRPRLPLYQSDGFGRDYYIKVTNGGFWENESIPQKKPDYVRSKYNNFHTLFHLAAPFKYWGDGSGRENYILKCNGFIHDQKPLCSYVLTDFLRNGKNIKGTPDNFNYGRKVYYSVAENKYNQKLKNLEKKLIKRLYTIPMKKKKKIQIDVGDGNKDKYGNNIELKNFGYQTCGPFNTIKKNFNTLEHNKKEYCDEIKYKRENSCGNKIFKNYKTLENNTILPKFKSNFKKNENTSDYYINDNYDVNKKQKKKIQFLTPKNIQIKNYELGKDALEEMGYKKAVVGGKLISKKIKIV